MYLRSSLLKHSSTPGHTHAFLSLSPSLRLSILKCRPVHLDLGQLARSVVNLVDRRLLGEDVLVGRLVPDLAQRSPLVELVSLVPVRLLWELQQVVGCPKERARAREREIEINGCKSLRIGRQSRGTRRVGETGWAP